MRDSSKRLMDIINRVEPKYGCMVLDMFIDDVGNERANEIIELSEGMMKFKNYLTEGEAKQIVDAMINYDGTKGAKWSADEFKDAVKSLNGKCEMEGEYNWWAMYVTAQMIHSDEWGVLRTYIEPSKEAVVCYELAKAKLLDKDKVYNVRRYFEV